MVCVYRDCFRGVYDQISDTVGSRGLCKLGFPWCVCVYDHISEIVLSKEYLSGILGICRPRVDTLDIIS